MYSVRRRLMGVLGAGFAVLLAGTGVYLERLVSERVTQEFDTALVARTLALATLTEAEPDGGIEMEDPKGMLEFEREELPDYFQFWILAEGAKPYRSARLKGDLPRSGHAVAKPLVRDARLPDGRIGRVAEISFQPGARTPGVTLVVAHGRERLDELLASVRLALFGLGGGATLLAVVFLWRSLAAGLRPLDAIAAQVQSLDADRLDQQVSLAPMPRELAPIVDQLNALLQRMRASLERERRFAGFVAHELRTPIAELRSLAAVGGKWPEDRESVVRFFADVSAIGGRMDELVSDLLLLARCQAGVERTVVAPTNLRELVEEGWSKLAAAAARRGLRFDAALPDDLVVATDAGKLTILLANLLGNAVAYATEGGDVSCRALRTADGGYRIEVENPAPALAAEELERLAEPFWRKDEARSGSEHVGLGLAVVSALAQLLELEITFGQTPEGRFRAVLVGRPLRST